MKLFLISEGKTQYVKRFDNEEGAELNDTKYIVTTLSTEVTPLRLRHQGTTTATLTATATAPAIAADVIVTIVIVIFPFIFFVFF